MRKAASKICRAWKGWSRRRKAFVACWTACVFVAAIILSWPMDVDRYLAAQSSPEMLDRLGRLMHPFLNEDDNWAFERRLEQFSPVLIQAVLAAEDQRFYNHVGVDPLAVVRAAWQNLTRRRIVSGASTITMQVVKLADHSPRTLWGKIRQAVQAVRLELRTTKDQILCAYLNRAPYGLNLIGAEAAARRYFGKPALELTIAEAALIAGLPKAPTSLMPLKHPDRATVRRNYVLRRMLESEFISEEEHGRCQDFPVKADWHAFPTLAPHMAMRLKPNIVQARAASTTLDFEIQRMAEKCAADWMEHFKGQVDNCAVVCVDVSTASILSSVGSPDFWGEENDGQFDATRAERSPGSALKPFTYALAMERNQLYACEMLLDAPLDYGRYRPENYDKRNRGLVSASDALRCSLNVPAVTVMERMGAGTLQTFLQNTGIASLARPAERYGLGLTLGACEVRLEELAGAYCMLASQGRFRPLAVLDKREETAAEQALSRGVCLKLFEMLERALPQEIDIPDAALVAPSTRLCWKTGTSSGHRDAWAFVFNGKYLVGVWMGNSDGSPSRRLVGAEAALPLAGAIFRRLPQTVESSWPAPGADLRETQVCAATGLPPSEWCASRKATLLPRGQYTHRRCDVHGPVSKSERIAERWPGGARKWDLANVVEPVAPDMRSDEDNSRRALRILVPVENSEFVFTGATGGDRLRLQSSLDRWNTLHWYLDDLYVGPSSPKNSAFIDLAAGQHKLTCMTASGQVAKVKFSVSPASSSVEFR